MTPQTSQVWVLELEQGNQKNQKQTGRCCSDIIHIQERASFLQVHEKLITTFLLRQSSHWHDSSSQNAILISTHHTYIKKNNLQMLCICNSLNAFLHSFF